MHLPNVGVVGGAELEPRQWLQREVLWCSLMVPYGQQLGALCRNEAIAQYHGNRNRQELFASESNNDPVMLANSVFNHGKNVAASISRVCALKAASKSDSVHILAIQTQEIDKVLSKTRTLGDELVDIEKIFSDAGNLARKAFENPDGFGFKNKLIKSAKIMSHLAIYEAGQWIENMENIDTPICLPNGGTARSGGPRVEMLRPVFEQIMQLEEFQRLTNQNLAYDIT